VAAQALVEHERLVHWVVRQQWLGALSYAAAVQAGRLALWRAARGYDPQRGVAFSTCAASAMRQPLDRNRVADYQAFLAQQRGWLRRRRGQR